MGSRPTIPGGAFKVLDEADHDLQNPVICGDRYLAYTMNVAGADRLIVLDLHSGGRVAVPELPEGVLELSCSRTGTRMLLGLSTFDTPGDLYLWDIAGGSLQRVFESTLAGLGERDFVAPSSILVPARDGVELQGLGQFADVVSDYLLHDEFC